MAYSSGSSTDALDLITDMETFTSSNGWTTDSFVNDGTGKRLHIHKGSLYFNFRYYNNEVPINGGTATTGIFCNGSTSYSGAQPWYSQPGAPTYNTGGVSPTDIWGNSGMNKLTGAIPSWHFFSFTNASWEGLYFIIENPAGIYQWILCGSVDKTKYGTSTGGNFFTGLVRAAYVDENSPISFFGADVDGWEAPFGTARPVGFLYTDNGNGTKWAWSDSSTAAATLGAPRCFDSIRKHQILFYDQPNTFNSLAVLFPVTVNVFVDGNNFTTTTPWSPVGELPFVYWVNIQSINPASTFSIASDQYKAFPFLKKTTKGAFSSSFEPRIRGTEFMGFAIRIDI